ncbi:MAG: hypothetical protein WCO98_04305 [bacterium]
MNNNLENILFPQPTIGVYCDGVPIYSYGYTHILGQGPDLIDVASMQMGNDAPLQKIRLKKSSEIGYNLLGGTTPRMPRTPENDYLPVEPIHLIDGDPTTCWCSRTIPQSNAEPAWIRIDLAGEKAIEKIVLRKRIPGAVRNQVGSMRMDEGAVEVGMAIPDYLEIKVSCDAMNWETVFIGSSEDTPEKREFSCEFIPRKAKQIWIIGKQLKRVENWHFSFSIASVDVYDLKGRNLALASRGAGATVSSTQHTMGQTREEHHRLWPVFADLGLKWIRVGYHDDPINWHWVEKEKGKLEIDHETDAAVTHAVNNGIDIVMSLNFGNRLYSNEDPTRKLPQLWEWYYENPRPPTTPEALIGWGNYIRFMCRHFKDRVKVFEVWNEWNCDLYWGEKESLQNYLAVARVAIPIIREECPDAKVMMGSVAGFSHLFNVDWTPEQFDAESAGNNIFLSAVRELAKDVDIIGWHPYYQPDPDTAVVTRHREAISVFDKWAAKQGFKGVQACTEYNIGASCPSPSTPFWWGNFECSEIEKAKYVARHTTLHTSLGISSFFCEVWANTNYPLDLGLMRRSFAADPISPLQPQPAYYAMRNLSTAFDGLNPDNFMIQVIGAPENLEICTMSRPGEKVAAIWLTGKAQDECEGLPVQVVIQGIFKSVIGFDSMNGVEQELAFSTMNGETILDGILLKDYPVLLRFCS